MRNKTAVVMGYGNLGNLIGYAQHFRRRNFDKIIALVEADRIDFINKLEQSPEIKVQKIDSTMNPIAIADSMKEIISENGGLLPFLCTQDRSMFSYIHSQKRLEYDKDEQFHIPIDSIVIARIKPAARAYWESKDIDCTKWVVLSGDNFKCIAGHKNLKEAPGSFMVKPLCGMSSEQVKCVDNWKEVIKYAKEVRKFFQEQLKSQSWQNTPREWTVNLPNGEPITYQLYEDILVEEKITGSEYTVDGCIFGDEDTVCCVVQHKENRFISPFCGNGLIMSPPDYSGCRLSPFSPKKGVDLELSEPCKTKIPDFEKFVTQGVKAIGLKNWCFHAEVMETEGGLRFIELNPRPPGGLLWKTAQEHIGIDLSGAIVDFYLKRDFEKKPKQPNYQTVTGEFPIYAFKKGWISKNNLSNLDRISSSQDVLKITWMFDKKIQITNTCRENYLAFVALKGKNHRSVRELARNIYKQLEV